MSKRGYYNEVKKLPSEYAVNDNDDINFILTKIRDYTFYTPYFITPAQGISDYLRKEDSLMDKE